MNHATVQRVIDVQCSVTCRDLGAITSEIQKAIDGLKNLPKGTRISIHGQSESMFNSFRSLGVGLILATILVYLLMVILFQSWLDPFIITVAVPGALTGILWMLAVTCTPPNFQSFLGSILAAGNTVFTNNFFVQFPQLLSA